MLGRAATYAMLAVMAVLTLTPLVWMIAAAFKGPDDLFHYLFFPPPERLSTVNFQKLFEDVPFVRYLVNSVFVTSTTVIVQLVLSSMAGFALAKYEFKGKKWFMALMLLTLMIPTQVTMAPLYELIYRVGLMDSHAGLIVPNAISVFGIFLFRQYFLGVPDEMLQAARIDGCSEFGLYRDMVMPVSRPMVGAFCLISFLATWNSFLWPQIILHTSARFTLPIALQQLVGLYQQEYGALMAGTLLSIVPVVVLFLLLQKEFIAGLTAGAVKG
jgi:ABC-type glycerol-3-phosphate transport system permease component